MLVFVSDCFYNKLDLHYVRVGWTIHTPPFHFLPSLQNQLTAQRTVVFKLSHCLKHCVPFSFKQKRRPRNTFPANVAMMVKGKMHRSMLERDGKREAKTNS